MPRFSLTTKLALLLSAFSLVLVLGVVTLVKATFDSGFDRYINNTIAERMEALAEHLAQSPDEVKELMKSRRVWERYLRNYYRQLHIERDTQTKAEANRPHVHDNGIAGRPFAWLISADKAMSISASSSNQVTMLLQPIRQNDQILGYLTWREVNAADNAMDAHFASRQHRFYAVIALVSVLISCLLAWPLSRYLVNPVRRLSAAMQGLTHRQYQQRVPETSDDELGQLARDFNVMAHTLEQHDTEQRQWLADISHELRTPIGVLKGELEAIEDGVLPLDMPRIQSLTEEVNQLARLVDDLHQLAVTQMSHLRYQFEVIDLNNFMHQLAARIEPMMAQGQLTFQLEQSPLPAYINADPQRLEQLVMNLAQNSLRYTDSGGKVLVSIGIAETVSLKWQDSAPGLTPSDCEHLFDRFYRVEKSRHRSLGGSGLGLFIVANIAEAHSAHLSAAPSALGGLLINCQFPAISHAD